VFLRPCAVTSCPSKSVAALSVQLVQCVGLVAVPFLWTVHCTVDSLLEIFGSISSFVKLATACLMLGLRRRGAVPLLHSYAFMACTVTALTRFKLVLLLTKCTVRLLRSAVWPWVLPHLCTVCRLALRLVRNIDGEIDSFFLIGCILGRDFPVL